MIFKYLPLKFIFLVGITPLCTLLISGCDNKNLKVNQSLKKIEVVDRIEGVAALGQLNPLGEVRKLAAPTVERVVHQDYLNY